MAAAADLTFPLREIAADFERQTGIPVRLTFGASGNLLTQIQQGAPFDVYFSADTDYPQRAIKEGLAVADSLTPYAVGQLVVFVPHGTDLDLERHGLDALTSAKVSKLAFANPAHAPYGRAAEAALKKGGVYDKLKERLVMGENVAQTAQFVRSGDAQAGLISLSLAQSPDMTNAGKYWKVPQDLYPPLVQSAVVLKRAAGNDDARKFLQYVAGDAGRAVLRRHGFQDPPKAAPPKGDGR